MTMKAACPPSGQEQLLLTPTLYRVPSPHPPSIVAREVAGGAVLPLSEGTQ